MKKLQHLVSREEYSIIMKNTSLLHGIEFEKVTDISSYLYGYKPAGLWLLKKKKKTYIVKTTRSGANDVYYDILVFIENGIKSINTNKRFIITNEFDEIYFTNLTLASVNGTNFRHAIRRDRSLVPKETDYLKYAFEHFTKLNSAYRKLLIKRKEELEQLKRPSTFDLFSEKFPDYDYEVNAEQIIHEINSLLNSKSNDNVISPNSIIQIAKSIHYHNTDEKHHLITPSHLIYIGYKVSAEDLPEIRRRCIAFLKNYRGQNRKLILTNRSNIFKLLLLYNND